jgi:hypothetical protein
MWSDSIRGIRDWVRAFKDRELLFQMILNLSDRTQLGAERAARRAADGISRCWVVAKNAGLIALGLLICLIGASLAARDPNRRAWLMIAAGAEVVVITTLLSTAFGFCVEALKRVPGGDKLSQFVADFISDTYQWVAIPTAIASCTFLILAVFGWLGTATSSNSRSLPWMLLSAILLIVAGVGSARTGNRRWRLLIYSQVVSASLALAMLGIESLVPGTKNVVIAWARSKGSIVVNLPAEHALPLEVVLAPESPLPNLFGTEMQPLIAIERDPVDGSITRVFHYNQATNTGLGYKLEPASSVNRNEVINFLEKKRRTLRRLKAGEHPAKRIEVLADQELPVIIDGNGNPQMGFSFDSKNVLTLWYLTGARYTPDGQMIEPVTQDMASQVSRLLEAMKRDKVPLVAENVDISRARELTFFDGYNRPQLGYSRDVQGRLMLWKLNGATSTPDGETIQPVTLDVVRQVRELEASLIQRRQMAEANQTAVEAEQKRITIQARARQEQQALIERVLQKSPSGSPSPQVAVFIAAETQPDLELTKSLIEELKADGRAVTDALFQPAFASDPTFDQILHGDSNAINALGLRDRCEYVLIGRRSDSFEPIANSQGIWVDTASVDVRVISTNGGGVVDRFPITVESSGFAKNTSREAASDKLRAQLKSHRFEKLKTREAK